MAKIPVHDYAAILTKHATLASLEIAALVGKGMPVSVTSVMTVHTGGTGTAQTFGMAGKVGIPEGQESEYLQQVLKTAIASLANKDAAVLRSETSTH